MRHFIKLFLFLIISFGTIAQVTIDLPVNKSVFQRNALNKATIYIAGSFANTIVTSIQARLVTPGTSTPISGFNWTIIDKGPTKGKYFGSLENVPAGWYTLEVRVVKNGTPLATITLSRVGIGDVYLAFGQSNAQGQTDLEGDYYGESAVSDLVISHNYFDTCSQDTPPFPIFTKISKEENLGQHGIGAWLFGELGDKLVTAEGVPVAFFNAASGGASLENFISSSNGDSTKHYQFGSQFCKDINPNYSSGVGAPYAVFKKTLRYYNSLYGIRAILWHQGESETYLGTSLDSCTIRLSNLILKTRTDFGNTMPWLVSRASYFQGSTSANVINSQNAVINPSNQIFTGPFTDDILTANRFDDLHFNNTGITTAADKWSNYLTTDIYNGNTQSFYDISNPIPAKTVPNIDISIIGTNVTLTAPGTYSSYKWVNGNNFQSTQVGSGSSFTASSGTYRCYMLDANENISVSQAFNIGNILSQQSNTFTFVDSLFLSDQIPYSITNGLGPISLNQSVGLSGDGDGTAIQMKTVSYSKGIGVHSGSEVVYKMPSGFHKYFKATIGVNDNVMASSSVVYKVYGESTLLYTSPVITNATVNTNIQVEIAGFSTIKLVVENNGGILDSNQVNWANARILFDKPDSLFATNIGTKCFNINWLSDNDQKGIASYQVFKNSILVGTTPSGTLTYQLTGLNQNTAYTIGIKAIDNLGNISALVSKQVTTVLSDINYPNFICVGTPTLPLLINPTFGTYSISNGNENGTINPTTGELTFTQIGQLQVKYQWGDGSCAGQVVMYVNSTNKVNPPTIASSINLVNKTDSVTFSSTTCTSPATVKWANNMTGSNIKIPLTDTTSFYAFCKNSNCLSDTSNKITIKVIPDCPSTFNLTSIASDLDYGTKSFKFYASQSIMASNKIINPTGAIYKAVQKIELNPGFEIKPGSVFSATIGGCP